MLVYIGLVLVYYIYIYILYMVVEMVRVGWSD